MYTQAYKEGYFCANPTQQKPHAATVKALMINHAYQYNIEEQATRYQQGWGAVNIDKGLEIGDRHLIDNEDTLLKSARAFLSSAANPR